MDIVSYEAVSTKLFLPVSIFIVGLIVLLAADTCEKVNEMGRLVPSSKFTNIGRTHDYLDKSRKLSVARYVTCEVYEISQNLC